MTVDLQEDYLPLEKEEYMNEKQLEYFRRKLLIWKQSLMEEAKDTIDSLKEKNLNEPDINDRATAEIGTTFELRSRDRYRKLIYKIDQALERIDNKEYGYCQETGEQIGIKRLEARPIATLCIEAQERHERYEKQHSED